MLLSRLFDHAPLFPPAQMEMGEALEEDRRARLSRYSWMRGRFVCPATELAGIGDEQIEVSAVVDGDLPDDPRVESVEAHAPVAFDGDVYVELQLGSSLESQLQLLAKLGLHAKVRCGGARIPSVEDLAAFVRGCRERGVVFKATAGLHHAYPTSDGEHGFLNLLAAAVFGDEEAALRAPPGSFQLDAAWFRWGGRGASAAEVARARTTLFHSIGSCSFFEPVTELHDLGIL